MNRPLAQETISEAVDRMADRGNLLTSPNDKAFFRRVFSRRMAAYVDRVRAIGFSGLGCVLDAGCGFGQWSLALAAVNDNVVACDSSAVRVEILRGLADALKLSNIEVAQGALPSLPYRDGMFDAAFCYGVIFLTPWRRSLQELRRVLKPGGRLYLTANDIGWYNFLWRQEHNKTDDYDPKRVAANVWRDTLAYDRDDLFHPGMNLLVEQRVLEHELAVLGFEGVTSGPEGTLRLDPQAPVPEQFFSQSQFLGSGVYESVSRKHI